MGGAARLGVVLLKEKGKWGVAGGEVGAPVRLLSALKSRYKWDLEPLIDVELRLISTTHIQLLWKSDFQPKFCR